MLNVGSGDLRTPVRIQRDASVRRPGEVDTPEIWLDIDSESPDEPPRFKWCQWIGAHGSEALTESALQGVQRATLRIRYNPGVTNDCRVVYNDEIWKIVSVDDIRRLRLWMELKVERRVAG